MIHETTLVRVFPSNVPIVPGHVLIIPRRHVSTMEELSKGERDALFAELAVVKAALTKALGATGFNQAWNEGECAGQSVPHLHLHVVPRMEGDAGVLTYEPRQFLYRPGSRAVSPDEELVAVATSIQKYFAP